MYTEAVDDEKLRLLAFEDRWHFVALLCCKGKGILDEGNPAMLRRKVAVKLGLDLRELDEVARRLEEVGLVVAETLQPLAWDHRQFQSDTSTERVKAYRERMKRSRNVSVTAQDTDTDTDTEKGIGTKAKRFRPPTLEEVDSYCRERGNKVNPQKFIAHYQSNGWVRGKTKIKDWKAAVRYWETNENENRTRTGNRNNSHATLSRIAAEDDPPELGSKAVSEVHGGIREALDGEYRRH
jgi:hypothetical protein